MKFLRILPETWVRTSRLFSSLTLNMAFGSVSVTTAMTSIMSSFDKLYPASARAQKRGRLVVPSVLLGQNSCSGSGHRHRVLKMSAHASIHSDRRPAVGQHMNFRLAGIHHGLDGNHHSLAQLHAVLRLAIVGHLRIFVHAGADAVAHEIADDGKLLGLNHPLHRGAYIAQSRPRANHVDGRVQRGFSNPQQPRRLRVDLFTPAAGVYFAGSAAFSIFTASN